MDKKLLKLKIQTPIGNLIITNDTQHIMRVQLMTDLTKQEITSVEVEPQTAFEHKIIQEFNDYFNGKLTKWSVPCELEGSLFQKQVWFELGRIPYGQTKSYSEIAALVGSPKAVRAVGTACKSNPIPLIYPCHRVISKSMALGQYALGGPGVKEYLLKLENNKTAIKKPTKALIKSKLKAVSFMNKTVLPEEIMFLDTETTGLFKNDEILQLAIVDGNEKVLFNEIFKPEIIKQWPYAQKVHGITPLMVALKKHLKDYYGVIAEILAKAKLLVIYNAPFDLGFLDKHFKKQISKIPYKSCLMRAFGRELGEWDQTKNHYKWLTLALASKAFKVKTSDIQLHDAKSDSILAVRLFWRLLKSETGLQSLESESVSGWNRKFNDRQ